MIFAALFGFLYLVFGIAMIASAAFPALAELTGLYHIPTDPAGGFVLCVIGAVFAFAYPERARPSAEGRHSLSSGLFCSWFLAWLPSSHWEHRASKL